jgi:hypothetical protein
MSQSDQINEIEEQLRRLQLSSQDTLAKREHEKELHARIQELQKNRIQEYESQQAEGRVRPE